MPRCSQSLGKSPDPFCSSCESAVPQRRSVCPTMMSCHIRAFSDLEKQILNSILTEVILLRVQRPKQKASTISAWARFKPSAEQRPLPVTPSLRPRSCTLQGAVSGWTKDRLHSLLTQPSTKVRARRCCLGVHAGSTY